MYLLNTKVLKKLAEDLPPELKFDAIWAVDAEGRIIGAVDELLRAGAVTALYITHRLDEIPPSIQRVLRLDGKGRASEETLPPGGRLPGRVRA